MESAHDIALAVITDDACNVVLMGKVPTAKLGQYGQDITQVFAGGKVELIDRDLAAAALREGKGETGLPIELVDNESRKPFARRPIGNEGRYMYYFHCHISTNPEHNRELPTKEPDAFKQLEWIPLEDLEGKRVNPDVIRHLVKERHRLLDEFDETELKCS